MSGESLGRDGGETDRNGPSQRLNLSPPPRTNDIGDGSPGTVASLGTISAVVVTYDSAACVSRCLASVRDALPDAELVVVDNGSQDDTVGTVRAATPHVRVIEKNENVGFGRACNTGAKAARGSHVLFINPDSVLAQVDRSRLEGLLTAQPFGLVAPALDGEGDRRRAENSWPAEYFAHTLETLRPREWRARSRPYDHAKAAWVSGAILLVSREEFIGLGGFDPRFFLYYEDRDLSRRYRDAGLPVRTTDAIRGRHAAGSSSAHNGLRARPMAWSLLGWIQYLSIHEGEREARRAARATLVTLRGLRLGMRSLAALRWPRARRKARQLDELLRLLAECASDDDARFCPDALRVIRSLA
jgi:N-acetylglucosaminyl-diphospho-decaprenol L-rhamnosyltransferase